MIALNNQRIVNGQGGSEVRIGSHNETQLGAVGLWVDSVTRKAKSEKLDSVLGKSLLLSKVTSISLIS